MIGFEGFPEFHRTLLTEVDERMNSPLSMLDAAVHRHPGGDVQKSTLEHLAVSLGRTAEHSLMVPFAELGVVLGTGLYFFIQIDVFKRA